MALVNYDYSSGSDNEITDEEEEPSSSNVVLNGFKGTIVLNQVGQTPNQINNTETNPQENILFATLPESRNVSLQGTQEEDKLEDFIPTVKTLKEKKKVQIPIPSLRDFDEPDNEGPSIKRIKPTQKASGLLGILPPVQSVPLSNISFVPNTVKSKNIPQKSASTSKGLVPDSVKKNLETKKMATLLAKRRKGSDSETDDDDDDMPIPDTFDDQMWEKVCGRTKPEKTVQIDNSQTSDLEQFTIAPEPEKPYDGLDNRAFKELVGKSKKPLGNIKLIDINEDEIKADQDLWMVKSLTDPEMMAPRGDPSDPVDPTKKRKHHITYLAQQAKANEQELKTAWASSKNNRMMSRSKYGF